MPHFVPEHPFFHFSVDDVCGALLEASHRGSDPFAHRFFAFLKHLHDSSGTGIDLYCFYQTQIDGCTRSLAEVPDSFREAFHVHDWLRFGPHALDYASAPYADTPERQREMCDLTYREIDRFAGRTSRSKWVRLHYFSESFELADYFHEQGVGALLTTDKPETSHRLPPEETDVLRTRGTVSYRGMTFVTSHFRLENLIPANPSGPSVAEAADRAIASHGFVTCLTHEYELARAAVREGAAIFLKHMTEHGIVGRC